MGQIVTRQERKLGREVFRVMALERMHGHVSVLDGIRKYRGTIFEEPALECARRAVKEGRTVQTTVHCVKRDLVENPLTDVPADKCERRRYQVVVLDGKRTDDIQTLLADVRRLLIPGGRLITLKEFDEGVEVEDCKSVGEGYFPAEKIVRVLSESGFFPVKVQYSKNGWYEPLEGESGDEVRGEIPEARGANAGFQHPPVVIITADKL